MKILVPLFLVLPLTSFATSGAEDAFERLNYELNKSTQIQDKADSLKCYLNSLSRLEEAPTSLSGCRSAIMTGKGNSALCLPAGILARSGGTGGVQ